MVATLDAIVWSDYLCPWAYLGRDRTRLLERLGVSVARLPFDLHPELPPEGRPVRPDGRLAAVFAHIAGECEAVGLPFRPPTRVPNTRRALQSAVLVGAQWPELAVAIDDALFEAVFVHDLDLGDPDVLDTVVAGVLVAGDAGDVRDVRDAVHAVDAGVLRDMADVREVRDAVDAGVAWPAVEASTAGARERGATGTPSWLLAGSLLVPGVQPREAFERWVPRLQARLAAADS